MKRITRDDLLHRIPTGSPYEAVIVAAREARRLNRARLVRQSLFPPMGAGLAAAAAELPAGSADPLGEEDPLVLMGDGNGGGSAHEGDFPSPDPVKVAAPEVKVTMQALERLAEGEVSYRIAEGPVDLEED